MFFITLFKKSGEKSEDKRKRWLPILIVACALVVALIAVWVVYKINYVPSRAYCEELSEYSLVASTEYEREQFFSQLGYSAESIDHSTVRIPSGGQVFEQYNNLQLSQGLDLKPYMGKQAHQYILRLGKDSQSEEMFGVLTVYKDRIIAVHLTDFIPHRPVKNLLE